MSRKDSNNFNNNNNNKMEQNLNNNDDKVRCEIINNSNSNEQKKENRTKSNIALSKAEMIVNCNSVFHNPPVKNNEIFVKLPVILSEFDLEIPFKTIVNLPYTANVIKAISNSVIITESILIYKANKLFLKGNVKKCIEYSSTISKSKKSINGILKHFTTIIPFQCTTSIEFFNTPVIFFKPSKKTYETVDKEHYGINLKESVFEDSQYSNEKIHCELIKYLFNESIKEEEKDTKNDLIEESRFNNFDLNSILTLTLRLIQKQKLKIII